MRLGVEVGGTFTDLVAIGDDGIRIVKVPSTPSSPDEGALAAIEQAGVALAHVDDLVHGSTVATNAILERKGAPLALIVTKGFRDILLLQRHNRRTIYDLFYSKPVPVVSRRDTYEVDERVAADGSVVRALDEAAAGEVLEGAFTQSGYKSVAICLLNSYANPLHERTLVEMLRVRYPELAVVRSSDVTREFREYERASTTTLAAYVQPVIERYLSRFERDLARNGFQGRFSVMQSNGGRLPAKGLTRNAITTLFSGPAAGVIGALRQAELSGRRNLITLDMGGTSTDVCLIAEGKPDIVSETEVDGLPIRTPVLDIVTVGAGGGSIIWIDDGGMLRVGPRSAGADPGPACYQRGGLEPTVTDAHLVRGSIWPEAFLGGQMAVSVEAARRALQDVSARVGMTPEDLADSAIRLADSNVVRAIQLVSTERGRDPRDYVLVPFGGAGPLHAARVAEELNIEAVLVPPRAGVLSAYGLLASDYVIFESRTQRIAVDRDSPEKVRSLFAEMERVLRRSLADLGITGEPRLACTLDMRYVGQAFEVPVTLESSAVQGLTADSLLDSFNEAHQRVFEFGDSEQYRAEIVSFRLGASVGIEKMPPLAEGGKVADRKWTMSTLLDGGKRIECAVLSRGSLQGGQIVAGPALIEDETSTIYVPSGWHGEQDENENLLMRKRV